MRYRVTLCVGFAALLAAASVTAQNASTEPPREHRLSLNQPVAEYVRARQAELAQIPSERRAQLDELGAYVQSQSLAGKPVRLTFICSHNSRRSQIAQVWAAVAAHVYGVRVATCSGGTESTAFNPRAVAALRRAGLDIEQTTDDSNPIYHVRYSAQRPALTCFSKVFSQPPNPAGDFAAIMVCDQADQACPAVAGAARRFALPFVDPKASDDTPREAATYDERCAQIAREMLYVMHAAGARSPAAGRPSQ